ALAAPFPLRTANEAVRSAHRNHPAGATRASPNLPHLARVLPPCRPPLLPTARPPQAASHGDRCWPRDGASKWLGGHNAGCQSPPPYARSAGRESGPAAQHGLGEPRAGSNRRRLAKPCCPPASVAPPRARPGAAPHGLWQALLRAPANPLD